ASMKRGATTRITAHVTHLGGGAAWLPLDSLPAVVVGTVRLGARWVDASGHETIVDNGELQHVVLPGRTVKAVLPLTAPVLAGRERFDGDKTQALAATRHDERVCFRQRVDELVARDCAMPSGE